VIEEAREMILKLAQEVFNRKKMSRGGTARETRKHQQQQKYIRGEGGQLQGKVWDPEKFQQWSRGAHE